MDEQAPPAQGRHAHPCAKGAVVSHADPRPSREGIIATRTEEAEGCLPGPAGAEIQGSAK